MSESDDSKRLKELWHQKLKDSGFEDIETTDGRLKRWAYDYARDRSLWSWEAKEAYYRMARYFLNDYEFKTSRERIIWEYHAEGISIRDIVKLLKKARLKGVYRRIVWETVHRLEVTMKKMYIQDNNE